MSCESISILAVLVFMLRLTACHAWWLHVLHCESCGGPQTMPFYLMVVCTHHHHLCSCQVFCIPHFSSYISARCCNLSHFSALSCLQKRVSCQTQTCSKPDTARAEHHTHSIAQEQIPLYSLEQMRYKVVRQVHSKGQAVGVEQGLADVVHDQLCQG